MEIFLRIYLPIYLFAYLAIAFIVPTYKTWKQTGLNPITFGKADTAHNYIGFIMKVLIALLFIAVLCFSIGSKIYNFIGPIDYLQIDWLKNIGLAIIHISLVWIAIAQYQMSTSWRIGIDEENKTELKTKGIFSISRNPIFLGMILSILGVFFILPNTLTFFLTLTTYFIIQIQIRLEEEFLKRQHGKNYEQYCKSTSRLI
jgi:protein-S-isoprenylcysteine O-methyltransferase Ste14